MRGDYSQPGSDPNVDLAGASMQQARVQLDANWTEFVALHGRRLRAASDLIYLEAWQREDADLAEPESVPPGQRFRSSCPETVTLAPIRVRQLH